jgi:hypothetical protein
MAKDASLQRQHQGSVHSGAAFGGEISHWADSQFSTEQVLGDTCVRGRPSRENLQEIL